MAFCEICNELKDDLKSIYNKIQLDIDFTEDETNPVCVIQKIFNIKDFKNKFYPDDQVFKGICLNCINDLVICYNFYTKVKLFENSNDRPQDEKKPKIRKILPKIQIASDLPETNNIVLTAKCYECYNSFKTLGDLKRHEKLHKIDERSLLNYCKYCNSNFSDKDLLKHHVKNNHVDKKYFCRKCSSSFENKEIFSKHFEGSQCDKCRYYCSICDYQEFEFIKELCNHFNCTHAAEISPENKKQILQEKELNNLLELEDYLDFSKKKKPDEEENNEISGTDALKNLIEELDINAETESLLNSDELVMDIEFLDDFFLNQDENSTQFNDCWEALGLNFLNLETDFDDLKVLAKEPIVKQKIDFSFKCPKCEKDFTNQNNLFIHLAHIHHEYVLVCSTCACKFNRVDEFVQHKARHFKENLTDPNYNNISVNNSCAILKCSKCKKSFKQKFQFLIHLCKTDPNVMVQCSFCTDLFPNWKRMYEHQKNVHSKRYQCTLCDEKEFQTLGGFKYHLKSHDGTKEFECPYCKKKFLAATNLNSHLKTVHANFKFHICNLCDNRFATLGHLKKHVGSVHQKERNFICSICLKGFAQSSHLKQHLEIHTGQRKYPCNYCSKQFSRKIDLTRHVDKHYKMYENNFKNYNDFNYKEKDNEDTFKKQEKHYENIFKKKNENQNVFKKKTDNENVFNKDENEIFKKKNKVNENIFKKKDNENICKKKKGI